MHCYTQNKTKHSRVYGYLNLNGLLVIEKIFMFFYCNKMETNDPRDGNIVERRGIIIF